MVLNQATCDALQQIVGRTILRIEYGSTERNPLLHQGQMLIFYFDDGTAMSLFTGTNIGNLCDEPSDLFVDLTAVCHPVREQPFPAASAENFPTAPASKRRTKVAGVPWTM